MGLDILAQRLVDPGLIATPAGLEPGHQIRIQAERQQPLDGAIEPPALGTGPVGHGRRVRRVDRAVRQRLQRRQLGLLRLGQGRQIGEVNFVPNEFLGLF